MVTFDPLSLLPPEELVRLRSPRQLRAWVLDRCDAIAKVPEAKRSALLHLGPFKRFYEEVYPLSLFAVRRYGEQDDVVCVPNRDEGRDFAWSTVSSLSTGRCRLRAAGEKGGGSPPR